MSKSDGDYFNCSEKHEIDYVVDLYKDSQEIAVRQVIKDGCESGEIFNFTRKQLYDYLEEKGFKK